MVVPANVYDSLFSTDKLQVDVTQALGTAVEATSGQFHVLDDAGNTVANESKQDTIDTVVDAIKAKTDNLPTDPASETNVNANETKIDTLDTVADAIKAVTDNLPNSGALDDLAAILADTGTEGVIVQELKNTALADFFNTDSGDDYDTAAAGSVVKEIADNAGGTSLSEAGIADAVWDEARSGHTAGGTFGEGVNVIQLLQAAIADLFNTDSGDDYDTSVAGSLVKEIVDNAGGASAPTVVQIRQEMDTNSTKLADILADTNELQTDDIPGALAIHDGKLDTLDTVADAIKAKTDNLPADPASETNVNANETKIDTLDTVADAIKAKTDNLPADPASETNVNANETKIDTLDTVADAIKAVTDNLPDSGALDDLALILADTGTDGVVVADKTGYSLSSGGIAAIWTYVIEGTLTAAHAVQALFAAIAGKASGGGTANLTFRDHADTKDRIIATVDTENGDRTAISYNFD